MQVGRRVLLASSLFFCGCGCVLMMDVGEEPISLVRYLTSLSIILAFTNILEGVTMSVMGDVIHPLMAAGFWNAGTPLSTGAQFEPKRHSDPWVVFVYRICILVASEAGCRDLCSKHMRAYLLDAPCEQVDQHAQHSEAVHLYAGLLTTQSGSIGRLFGNFSITVFGSWTESTIILGNEMYLALLFCVALCGLLFLASFSRLQKLA